MSEIIKPVSSDETHDEITPVKNASVEIETKQNLKHLSPVIIEEEDWQNILTNPITTITNESFQADKCTIDEKDKKDIFSDYYKTNRNNHFVWTNQNVIRDCNISNVPLPNKTSIGDTKYEHCDSINPDESFELRHKSDFGFGLYAKTVIPKGLFCVFT